MISGIYAPITGLVGATGDALARDIMCTIGIRTPLRKESCGSHKFLRHTEMAPATRILDFGPYSSFDLELGGRIADCNCNGRHLEWYRLTLPIRHQTRCSVFAEANTLPELRTTEKLFGGN